MPKANPDDRPTDFTFREFSDFLRSLPTISDVDPNRGQDRTICGAIKLGVEPDTLSICVRNGPCLWVDMPVSAVKQVTPLHLVEIAGVVCDFARITFANDMHPTTTALCSLVLEFFAHSDSNTLSIYSRSTTKRTVLGTELPELLKREFLSFDGAIEFCGSLRISKDGSEQIEVQLAEDGNWIALPEELIQCITPLRNPPQSQGCARVKLAHLPGEVDAALQTMLRIILTAPCSTDSKNLSANTDFCADRVQSNDSDAGPIVCYPDPNAWNAKPCFYWVGYGPCYNLRADSILSFQTFGTVYLLVPPVKDRHHITVRLESAGQNITNQSGVDPTGGPYAVDVSYLNYAWSMRAANWQYLPAPVFPMTKKTCTVGDVLWMDQREDRGNGDEFSFPEVSRNDALECRWYTLTVSKWTNITRRKRMDDPRAESPSTVGIGLGAIAYCRWNDGKWGGRLVAKCHVVQ